MKKCWCKPELVIEACSSVPDSGAGLLLVQFHVSPLPEGTAPFGNESFTQLVSVVPEGVFVLVLDEDELAVDFPM
jgi:hypothetical protein